MLVCDFYNKYNRIEEKVPMEDSSMIESSIVWLILLAYIIDYIYRRGGVL